MDDDLGDHRHDTDASHKEDESVEILVQDCDDGPSKPAEDETDDWSDDECLGRPGPDHAKNEHDSHHQKVRHTLYLLVLD